MEAGKWFRSFSTGGRNDIQLGRHYDPAEFKHGEDGATSKKGSIWKVIWRKFLKEKKNKSKMMMKKSRFELSRSVHVQIPSYDEYSYSQNFDKGCNWDEPDQLLRSFSVRYADRSRMILFK